MLPGAPGDVEGGDEEDILDEGDGDGDEYMDEQGALSIQDAIEQNLISNKEIDCVNLLLENFEIGSEEVD